MLAAAASAPTCLTEATVVPPDEVAAIARQLLIDVQPRRSARALRVSSGSLGFRWREVTITGDMQRAANALIARKGRAYVDELLALMLEIEGAPSPVTVTTAQEPQALSRAA